MNMSSVAVAPLRDAKGHFLPKVTIAEAGMDLALTIKADEVAKSKVAKPKAVKPKVSKPKVAVEGRRLYTTKWDKAKNVMTCTCKETWTPKFREGNKRLVRGSWMCPKGCCTK